MKSIFSRATHRKPMLVAAALVAATVTLLSPVLVASSAEAATGYVGVPSGSGGTWQDDSLATMTQNQSYSDSVQAPLGGPYGPLDSANVPDGIGLFLDEETGVVTVNGTPTGSGAFDDFEITVGGSDGAEFTLTFSGSIVSADTPPTWSDSTLADFRAGEAYSDGVTATGSPTIVYSVSGGTLPSPLALDSATGAITGTPAAAGAYDFVLTATNDFGHTDQEFAGSVLPPHVGPTWTDTTIAQPRVGDDYADGVAASGDADITYSVTDGALPDGLALDAPSGAILGVPQTAGPYDVTIEARNDYGHVDHEFTGTVLPAPVPPTWTDATLAEFQVSVAYSDSVAAVGDATIVYSVSNGTLPAGITLDSATGVLSGTPTDAVAYNFTLRATNDAGHVDIQYIGGVAAAPALDLTLNFAAGTKLGDASTEISASGLLVGSTYTLTLHSAPVVLATGTVDGTGGFDFVLSLPPDTPAGAHELTLTGIAPDGRTLTAHAWFTLLSNGRIGAVSYTGPLTMPADVVLGYTGVSVGAPLGVAAVALLTGFVLFMLRRRRTA